MFNQMVETYHLPGSELGSHQNVQKECFFFPFFSFVDDWKQIGNLFRLGNLLEAAVIMKISVLG